MLERELNVENVEKRYIKACTEFLVPEQPNETNDAALPLQI